MRRGQRVVLVQLAAGEADEVRRVQSRVLGVDGDEHLDDVVFRQSIENDGRDGELLVLHVVDIRVQRQETMLPVDGPKDPFPFGHLQTSDRGAGLDRFERQLLVTGNDDSAGNRRQVASLTALLVVLHEFVDLSPDDLSLIGFLARRDASLEQIPVHL